ncbi:hypothetical protein MXD62_19520 [Frankia sp. Mgl5]|uniref:hypothetical protein n=1 Tax=Frankia sp. Mgl5 TaxID=2933793 RepID=UPI00200CB51A|nr:hypothetical protein [Frankia sp. Mgl5]MCK9929342.1 hypothetical protein [Frankia sp. Mgl5]
MPDLRAALSSPTARQAVADQLNEAAAWMRLMSISGTADSKHMTAAATEVERRWDLYRQRAPALAPVHPNPRQVIIDSVYRDVRDGLL